ncbi:MAG TPA: RHS repeat-associated core domain-containing protein [Dehalococcoidia bacterium]|nr:RHS repeat-associated core domain-containing protein [Dehalococcoidia bacterium]
MWLQKYSTGPAQVRLQIRNEGRPQDAYNLRNQLTGIDYRGGTPDVTFDYDDVGNRTEMVDATGTTTYDYDALDRLTAVTFPGSRIVGYTYDAVGNRASVIYPGGSDSVDYEYDEAGNLVSVTDWNSDETTYDYDDAGLLEHANLANGVVGTYTYDDADRLTGIHWVKGANTLTFVDYTLDDVGNRTQRVDGLGTHTYGYDDLYRLTSVTYPGPDDVDYTYDAVGNRQTLVDGNGTTNYGYDAADRLTSVDPPSASPVTYTWDDNGNLTARGSDSFAWDAEDHMTSATVSSVTTTFAYNGDGLRDSLTVNSNMTTFTWDVNTSIPQVLDDEDFRYVYGLGRIAQVGADTYYYLTDGLGSTMALADDTGALVNTYDYDVFGAERASTGSQANDFTFAGEQVDESTGLQYLRARYYDVETGGFLSGDPLTKSPNSSGHAFSFARSNPTNLTDPTGLDPDEPIPVPAPPAGNFDDHQCFDGYDQCLNPKSWFSKDLKRRFPGLPEWAKKESCYNEMRQCQNRVYEGEDGYFDWGAVRENIQNMLKSSTIKLPLLNSIKPPPLGTAGLKALSKEGGVRTCF